MAATHKPLEAMVRNNQFRQDLYYRISAFPIHLPSLRERREDIPLLVSSLLQRSGTTRKEISVDLAAMRKLQQHSWPGNIRELRNVLERAILFADNGVISPEHLLLAAERPMLPSLSPGSASLPSQGAHNDEALLQALKGFKGTRKELAAKLGLSERTLYRRLRELGIHKF